MLLIRVSRFVGASVIALLLGFWVWSTIATTQGTRLDADGSLPTLAHERLPIGFDQIAAPLGQMEQMNVLTNAAVLTYTEDFLSYRYQDPSEAMLGWNIGAGQLMLPAVANGAQQQFPAIAMDEAGNSIIVWQDYRNGDDDPDIYAQKYDVNGRRLWPEDIRVNSDQGVARQWYPEIVVDNHGQAVVVWSSEHIDNFAIYGQKLDTNGQKVWGVEDKLVSATPADANSRTPAAVLDTQTNDVIVVWSDSRNAADDESENTYVQRLRPNGSRAWLADKQVNQEGFRRQFGATVGVDNAGHIFVAWSDRRNYTSILCPPGCPGPPPYPVDIYLQKLNAMGEREWSLDKEINGGSARSTPSLAIDVTNTIHISWVDPEYDEYNNEFWEIHFNKLDVEGDKLCSTDVQIDAGLRGTVYSPQVVVASNQQVFVAWTYTGMPPYDASYLHGQKINSTTCERQWSEDLRISSSGVEGGSDIASSVDGKIRAVWGYASYQNQRDIYLQGVSETAQMRVWGNHLRVNSDIGTRTSFSSIVAGGNGSSHVAWGDDRKAYDSFSIYAQKLSQNGQVLWPHNLRVNLHDTNLPPVSFARPSLSLVMTDTLALVWDDNEAIYARRYGSDEAQTWPLEVRVNQSNSVIEHHNPAATLDSDGNLYIVWADERNGDSDIFMQKVTSQGDVAWSEDRSVRLDTSESGRRLNPNIVFDSESSSLYVAWWVPDGGNIFLQRLDLAGNPLWDSDRQVNRNSYVRQTNLSIGVADGFIYVIWDGIYMQKFSSDGARQWFNSLLVNPDGEKPAAAVSDNGNIFVAWQAENSGHDDIFVQRFDAQGTAVWETPIRANSDSGKAKQASPHLSVDQAGNIFLAWEDYRQSRADIYAQKISSSGDKQWPNDVQVTPERIYPEMDTAASLQVNAISEPVTWATLSVSATLPAETAVSYELSVNGGATWEVVEPDRQHVFTAVGDDLRWRATLLANSDQTRTPIVDSLQIVYGFGIPPGTLYVLDEYNQPLQGAFIYHNGQLAGETDDEGAFVISELAQGDVLVALNQRYEKPTARAMHHLDGGENFAYRVYASNLILAEDDEVEGYRVLDDGEPPILRVRGDQPLVLFNVLVSIEWDANEAYVTMIQQAFEEASSYLYDVSDGQMAIGWVTVYDNAQYWADADFQIVTKNTVSPYAYVGGITSDDTAHSIRVGRLWNGSSGNDGNWDESAGYRTLIHEFSHYALYLYDEYFFQRFDEQGHLIEVAPAACTGLEIVGESEQPGNGSIMYYQYNASEFVDENHWTINCQHTEQARIHGGSDWQTISTHYHGADWILQTPDSRGGIIAGPFEFPKDLLSFPRFALSVTSTGPPTRTLTVLDREGKPYPSALVSLYTIPFSQTIAIDQGLTDLEGTLAVYGANQSDTIQVTSLDGAYAGGFVVDSREQYTITLNSTSSLTRNLLNVNIPFLNLVPGTDGKTLYLEVHSHIGGGLPLNAVVIPGEDGGTSQSTPLIYDVDETAYAGQVNLSGVGLGSGGIQVSGVIGEQLVVLNSNYNLTRLLNAQANELISEDGNFQLHLEAGSLPFGSNGFGVVLPTGYVPGPVPACKEVVGNAYSVRTSGAATNLEKRGLLAMHFHPDVVLHSRDLAIYQWDVATKSWHRIGGELGQIDNALVVPTKKLGTYALLRGTCTYLPFLSVSH